MNNVITPQKPMLAEDYHCSIYLSEKEVDTSPIKNRAEKEGFREQISRHITVLGHDPRTAIQEKLSHLTPETQSILIRKINTLLQKIDWSFEPKDYYYVYEENFSEDNKTVIEKRESYIITVKMPSMETFYMELNKLLNSNFPTQFPHITLFSKGELPARKYYGFPIESKEKFALIHPQKNLTDKPRSRP